MDPSPTAAFVQLVLGTLLYGIYIVLLIFYILFGKIPGRSDAQRSTSRRLINICTAALFVVITAQWILGITRASYDLIGHSDSTSAPLNGTDVARSALYFVEMTLAELRMIYRLWRVQQRQWAVVLPPSCMCIIGLMCGIIAIHCARGTISSEDCFTHTAAQWMVSALVLTATANIYCSAILLYTLWDVHRTVERASNASLRGSLSSKLSTFPIESNLLVTTSSVAVMIAFLAHCPALLPCINIVGPLVGIAFCLMRLARSGQRWDKMLGAGDRLARSRTKPPDVRLVLSN